MTQETLQRAKELEAQMELLDEDADNCQILIDGSDKLTIFLCFDEGHIKGQMRVPIPKTVLVEALQVIHKGITDQYEKAKQEFESL